MGSCWRGRGEDVTMVDPGAGPEQSKPPPPSSVLGRDVLPTVTAVLNRLQTYHSSSMEKLKSITMGL